jgi:uncharacterized SAM-binding protein YcdF (DUF218 family)
MPDFFVWSKVLPTLLYPLPLILLLAFVATWWLKKAGARWILRLLIVALWFFSTPWFAHDLSVRWETPLRSVRDLPPVSDAAIVLGGLSDGATDNPEHLEFNRAAERITEAVDLWRKGRVTKLLITSGSGDLMRPEAAEAPGLAQWARDAGVPDEALIVESRSRNTLENATLSLPLAEAADLHSFVLVTSAVHMPRSAAIFRKAGYASDGRTLALWPVDSQNDNPKFPFNAVADPSSLSTVQAVLKEMVGYVVYAVRGYL